MALDPSNNSNLEQLALKRLNSQRAEMSTLVRLNVDSARAGESRRQHIHEAVVAGTTEAQDLSLPLHDRSSNLAVSSVLERCLLFRRSARASQQTDSIVVRLFFLFFIGLYSV